MNGTLRIPVVTPYPWSVMLRYLSLRCTPGLETIEAERYTRNGTRASVAVYYDAGGHALTCEYRGITGPEVRQRLECIFDPNCDPRSVSGGFQRCAVLRPRVQQIPGLRIPGCWEPFELCVRAILGQQVTVQAAHTLMRRLGLRCRGMTAREVAQADLGQLGIPGGRTRSIRLLAEQVAAGAIRFHEQPWPEIAGRLREIPGFGPWTVEYLAIRLGRDADAFPASDLGLLRAAGAQSPAELLRLAEGWRPYRAYAAMYLWMAPISGPIRAFIPAAANGRDRR